MKRYAHPRQTLIFVLIAVTLMIALDVFVLKGWRPYRDAIGSTVQAEIVMPETQVMTITEIPADGQIGNLPPPPEGKAAATPAKAPEPVKVAYGPPRENKNSMAANAVPASPRSGKAKIALIIDDMGVDKRSKEVIELWPPLTLAFLPYASNLQAQTERARQRGHELIIHVPMQPMSDDVDPGPGVLKTDMSEEEFMASLNKTFESFEGYVGINNHMGSKLTQNSKAMKRIMGELKKHDLLFVDSKTIPTSVAVQIAQRYGVPYGQRDVFIDHNNDMPSIRASLRKLEEVAFERGSAIAIGHPRENTIKALKEWMPTLKDKGLVVVPVSQLVRRPETGAVAQQHYGPDQSPSPLLE